MDLKKLGDCFPSTHIEWRIGQCGKTNGKVWANCLAYIQARAIMDRLDEVCGPMNWKAEYSFIGTTGVVCRLSVYDREAKVWVTKEDGAEMTDIEPFKGGISGALKRAAVLWQIGRYLYDLEVGFAEVSETRKPGYQKGKTKDGTEFYWAPPSLPGWALPVVEKKTLPPVAPPLQKPPVIPNVPLVSSPVAPLPPSPPPVIGVKVTTEDRGALIKLAEVSGWSTKEVQEYIQSQFKKALVTSLKKEEFDRLMNYVAGNPRLARQREPGEDEDDKALG